MNLNQNTIQESKRIVQEMKETENLDINTRIAEVESEILLVFDEYEKHRRLHHSKEAAELFNRLERLYLAQSEPRRSQMKKVEELKSKLRILHAPFVERWLKDLTQDIEDVMAKKSVHGVVDPEGHFDRESGNALFLVTHNLRAISNNLKKVQTAIVAIREGTDTESLDVLEKAYLVGHDSVGSKLKEENLLATRESFNDLLTDTRQGPVKFDSMTLPEMVIEGSVNKTVQALEGLRKEFT